MDFSAQLAAAAQGDEAAWNELVAEFSNLLWSIGRGYRLDVQEVGDATQTTWLRLVENLDRIDDPARLPGWLATTMRRECLMLLRRAGRERVARGQDPPDVIDPAPPADHALLVGERDAALWRALDTLGEQCRRLLRVLMASPPPAYAEVAAALDMPIGSIGPARRRCLDRLRTAAQADELLGSGETP